MHEHINGSLLALACGDSYGSYYEMAGLIGERFDREKLPDAPIQTGITDDTKMAAILLKHYNQTKGIQPQKLFREYRKWAVEDGDKDGIGIHTKKVLVYGAKEKDSQGNGALMRNIPFGSQLIEDGYSYNDAVEMMNVDSSLTHANETIFQANALALDLALKGTEALKNERHQPILQRLHFGQTAWVIHSLYIVIEALKLDLNFIDGFRYIVSYGGDTDTNCAIYGAIRGHKEDITKSVAVESFLDRVAMEYLLRSVQTRHNAV